MLAPPEYIKLCHVFHSFIHSFSPCVAALLLSPASVSASQLHLQCVYEHGMNLLITPHK